MYSNKDFTYRVARPNCGVTTNGKNDVEGRRISVNKGCVTGVLRAAGSFGPAPEQVYGELTRVGCNASLRGTWKLNSSGRYYLQGNQTAPTAWPWPPSADEGFWEVERPYYEFAFDVLRRGASSVESAKRVDLSREEKAPPLKKTPFDSRRVWVVLQKSSGCCEYCEGEAVVTTIVDDEEAARAFATMLNSEEGGPFDDAEFVVQPHTVNNQVAREFSLPAWNVRLDLDGEVVGLKRVTPRHVIVDGKRHDETGSSICVLAADVPAACERARESWRNDQ